MFAVIVAPFNWSTFIATFNSSNFSLNFLKYPLFCVLMIDILKSLGFKLLTFFFFSIVKRLFILFVDSFIII